MAYARMLGAFTGSSMAGPHKSRLTEATRRRAGVGAHVGAPSPVGGVVGSYLPSRSTEL